MITLKRYEQLPDEYTVDMEENGELGFQQKNPQVGRSFCCLEMDFNTHFGCVFGEYRQVALAVLVYLSSFCSCLCFLPKTQTC